MQSEPKETKQRGRVVVENLDPGFIHDVETIDETGKKHVRRFHFQRPSAISEAVIRRVYDDEEPEE